MLVKTGQSLTLKIKRLGINGEGIGFFKRLIIFVPGALPKEEVQVVITKASEKFAEARLTKIKKASPDRQIPPCPVYEECGGCQLQHLTYNKQLVFKKDLLKQALEKFKPKGYQEYRILDTIGMDDPWHYRNKAQFQLQYNPKTKKIEAGLYQPNSHHLVPITDCLVQEPRTQKLMNTIIRIMNRYDLPIYDERKNSGIFRTIMVRIGVETNEAQIVFITHSKKFPQQNAIIRQITEQCPEVVSIAQNIQDKKTSLIMGNETIVLWGKESIHEQINEVQFDLSARAFFQLNPKQTKRLYQEAEKALDLQTNETVVDAYCGVGTIGLSLARKAAEVRGMDVIPEAIENAQKNATAMGLTNTHYEVGTAEDLLPKWFEAGFVPDGMVVDPPRTGLDQKLIESILAFKPRKLVYVSCNVSTLARDLVKLAKVYQVDYLLSVDMFPQTARCEVVVKLEKR